MLNIMDFKLKTKALFLGFLTFGGSLALNTSAKEGMRIPTHLLKDQKDILAAGLGIPVNLLFNADGTGLNNAVVLFGKGCTGELISSKGLILTNHHCGYGTVQGLANTQADYFANGFFAPNLQGEIPCPGLSVTFIRDLEDVSLRILNGLDDELPEAKRDSIISTRIKHLENGFRYTRKMDAQIKSFANGNQYWVILTETFNDIRLVAFPPNGIGSFGGDTDNWSWPRHTGDFSMFRIYADSNNRPAPFNTANQPYAAKTFFTINTNGYKEGDFTLVYGFPGTTKEYISSMELEHVLRYIDPIRIEARTRKLNVWNAAMQQDRNVFLQYTSKRASVANGWKKSQGELRGLELNNVVEKKRAYEKTFQQWALSSPKAPAYASDLLFKIQSICSSNDAIIAANEYINESVLGIELIAQAHQYQKFLALFESSLSEAQKQDSLQKLYKAQEGFYKNYNAATDQKVFEVLMPLFMEKCGNLVPQYFKTEWARNAMGYNKWAAYVFQQSALTSLNKLITISSKQQILNDPAYKIYKAVMDIRSQKIEKALTQYRDSMTRYNRLFMKARMLQNSYKSLYPDANLTLRVAYGKVKGLDPVGPAPYSYQTNLSEAVKKHNPEVAEFNAPEKLLALEKNKDYGQWAENGSVPIAFLADNHTSGGNSGSPVLNKKGELIGTNFDRVWEGTMSDYYFDERWCRNISLDIRYTLFIIDKLGGASWLLNEMKFAPKK